MAELVQRTSIRGTLLQMEVGETVGLAFGIVTGGTLRSIASVLGMEMERRYSVHQNRNDKIYEVTRDE